MSDIMSNELKIAMAKKVATVMHATMAGVPNEVQLEAVLLLAKALLLTTVKSTHRMSLFNSVVQKLRAELKEGK